MYTSETQIIFYRGDSYSKEFEITDEETGFAIDINGYTFTMSVDSRENPDSEDTQLFFLTGLITDASEGKVAFTPTSENNNQPPKTYFYDVQMVTGTNIRTVIKDKYIITQDITKTT